MLRATVSQEVACQNRNPQARLQLSPADLVYS